MAALTGKGRALALSCHPIPSIAVTALFTGLVLLAQPSLKRGALGVVAVLLGQLSIGWLNDAWDADRDRAVGRTDKPVAAGLISRRSTWVAAVTAFVAATAIGAALGVKPLLSLSVAVTAGWAYDLWLKGTALSWLPFALAFGGLPASATLLHGRYPAAWAVIAAALFGVAAHFTNVLPDLLDDEDTGIRGLPHRLGAGATAVIGPGLLALASAVTLLASPGSRAVLRGIVLVVVVGLAVWAAVTARRAPGSRTYFLAVIAVAALDLLAFAVSGGGLD